MREGTNNKNITHHAKLFLRFWNVGLFAVVWVLYYNPRTFMHFREIYASTIIVLFFFLYNWICSVYKAYRLASTPIFDLVFAHFIAFGITDLICYFEGCLIVHHFLNILPGLLTVAIQLIGTAFITTYLKNKLLREMKPKDTVLISGSLVTEDQVDSFISRLMFKYSHLYTIAERCTENVPLNSIEEIIAQHDTVILLGVSPNVRRTLIKICVELKREFLYDPRIEDIFCEGCTERHLLDMPLMKYDYTYLDPRRMAVKRVCDIIISLVVLGVFSPALLIIAIAIKLEDGGPVFYKQKRYTKDWKVFEILKFRSMKVDADKMGVVPTMENDPRVTKVGKIIRRIRFDELPQFINILKGDMSFIGPRPERVEQADQYAKDLPEFKYRMYVKGGLTGYAQVYGKYNTSAYDKLRLDLTYIENQSIILDIKIFLLTIRTIFQKESTEGFNEEKSQIFINKTNEE